MKILIKDGQTSDDFAIKAGTVAKIGDILFWFMNAE
jgi:hypothetical protein